MTGAACMQVESWTEVAPRPIKSRSLNRNINRGRRGNTITSTELFHKSFRQRRYVYSSEALGILIRRHLERDNQADERILLDFARKIMGDMQPIPSEIQQMVDEEFWDLF